MPSSQLVAIPQVEKTILIIRGEKVILDTDLATLYGVPTKVLNQAVKRNKARFPHDFLFQLTKEEKQEVVTICDHLKKIKYYKGLPYAFTEHGALMAASVLNSKTAVEVSVFVMRAFIKLRNTLSVHKQVARKLSELEEQVASHDVEIQSLFDTIRILMEPPKQKKKMIGFERK